MLFKTLVFLFILYLLIRAVRHFFLPGGKKQSNARFFYQAFRNIQKQQKKQRNQQQSQNKSGNNKFDEIEEADFEEIEEDNEKASD